MKFSDLKWVGEHFAVAQPHDKLFITQPPDWKPSQEFAVYDFRSGRGTHQRIHLLQLVAFLQDIDDVRTETSGCGDSERRVDRGVCYDQ
jgi:hypothetical protein